MPPAIQVVERRPNNTSGFEINREKKSLFELKRKRRQKNQQFKKIELH